MDPLSLALGGASIIGGLLGGHKDFGSAGDFGQGRNFLGKMGAVGGRYAGLADGALTDYAGDNAGYRNAVGDESRFLRTDPLTDSAVTGQVARMTAGTTDHFNAARASLSSDLARRGLTDSSQMAGGLAGIASAQAGTVSGAQNAVTTQALAQRAARMQANTSLMGGVASQDYGHGMQNLGAEAGVYGNLGNTYMALGRGEQGQEMAAQSAANGMIGQGAGILAGAFGKAPGASSSPLGGMNPYDVAF